MFKIGVACYAGYRGEETPQRLTIGHRQVAVIVVVDRWLAPDHRYFKILGDDDGIYIIRHDPVGGFWQLVSYKATPEMDRRAVDESINPPPSTAC